MDTTPYSTTCIMEKKTLQHAKEKTDGPRERERRRSYDCEIPTYLQLSAKVRSYSLDCISPPTTQFFWEVPTHK